MVALSALSISNHSDCFGIRTIIPCLQNYSFPPQISVLYIVTPALGHCNPSARRSEVSEEAAQWEECVPVNCKPSDTHTLVIAQCAASLSTPLTAATTGLHSIFTARNNSSLLSREECEGTLETFKSVTMKSKSRSEAGPVIVPNVFSLLNLSIYYIYCFLLFTLTFITKFWLPLLSNILPDCRHGGGDARTNSSLASHIFTHLQTTQHGRAELATGLSQAGGGL